MSFIKKMPDKIKQKRKEVGLTIKQTAHMLNIPWRTWRDWEKGIVEVPKWAEEMILRELEKIREDLGQLGAN